MSDLITPESPKRLIVLDYVFETAKSLFGDKYDYRLLISDTDSLENIKKTDKPVLSVILGDERSELYDTAGTILNEVLIGISIIKPIESNHIVHSIETLNDIEKIKSELLGQDKEYKENIVYGNYRSKEFTGAAAEHDIDYSFGFNILRTRFYMLLMIYTEREE